MTPCWPGDNPVVSDVIATAVVVGTTVDIGPPVKACIDGVIVRRSTSCCQPRPSSTSSTIWRAENAAGGNHAGDSVKPPSSDGTTLQTHGPE
jgi:hypothetical protein